MHANCACSRSQTAREAARLELIVLPAINAQPLSQTPSFGDTVTFEIHATGTAPLSYQWQFNLQDIPGATGPALTLSNVGWTNSGG